MIKDGGLGRWREVLGDKVRVYGAGEKRAGIGVERTRKET